MSAVKRTADLFIRQAETFYGEYRNNAVRKAVYDYLSDMSSQFLTLLWDQVKLTHSNVYGKPPDIAILEEARKEVHADYYPELQEPAEEHKYIEEIPVSKIDGARELRRILSDLAERKRLQKEP